MLRVILSLLFLQSAVFATDRQYLLKLVSESHGFNTEFVDALASLGNGEINEIRDENGRTLLHWVAAKSEQARGLALLIVGADVNAKDNRQRTPLFDIMEAKDSSKEGNAGMMMLEMLTLRGADVNAQDSEGTTPLAIAARRGDYRKAEFLVWRGAEVDLTGIPPENQPLAIARQKKDARLSALFDTVLRLKKQSSGLADAKKSAAHWPSPLEAARAADLNAVEEAIASGWNINQREEKGGATALYRATDSTRGDLVSLLILNGADPNIARDDGMTPLMASLQHLGAEDQRTTAMLMLSGANINAVAKDGGTPMTAAAAAGHYFGIQWLIVAGADPRAVTPKGSVADYCTFGPALAVLKHFGTPDKQPKVPETNPLSVLCEAAQENDLRGIERALLAGTPVDGVDGSQCNAISAAANRGHFEAVDLLLRHGANINAGQNKWNWSALHMLAMMGGAGSPSYTGDHIEKFLARGANPNIATTDGGTPLMTAARFGARTNALALLKGGAQVNLRTKEGLTAIGFARKYGQPEMIELLKEHGGVD